MTDRTHSHAPLPAAHVGLPDGLEERLASPPSVTYPTGKEHLYGPHTWADDIYVQTLFSRLLEIGWRAKDGHKPDFDEIAVLEQGNALMGKVAQ